MLRMNFDFKMCLLIADLKFVCTQDVQSAYSSVLNFNRVHLQLFTIFTDYTFLGTLIMKSKLLNVTGELLLCTLQETAHFS